MGLYHYVIIRGTFNKIFKIEKILRKRHLNEIMGGVFLIEGIEKIFHQ